MINAQSPFLKKLLTGTIWLTVGALASKILFFLASVILIKLLSKQEFGEFGIIKSTIDNFLVVATAGIGITTTKFVSELVEKNRNKVGSIVKSAILAVFILSATLVLLSILFSDYLLINVLKNHNLKFAFITGLLSLVFLSVNTAQLGALLGLQEYKSNSLLIILQGLLVFLGYVVGGYLGNVNGAILGFTVALFFLMLITNIILQSNLKKNNIYITTWTFKEDLQKILRFAVPASLSSLISAPIIWIINATLINTKDGYRSLGFFSTIIIFSAFIQMLNSAISNAMLPILLRDKNSTDRRDFLNYFVTWFVTIILSLPLLLVPEIVYYSISQKYTVNEFMPILCYTFLSAFIISNRNGVARDLILKNKMWLSVFSVGQSVITSYIIFRFFLIEDGAVGLALAFALAYSINYLIFVPVFIKLKISPTYIFYNKFLPIIWTLIILILYLAYLIQDVNIIYRLLILTLSLLLFILIFFKMFKNVISSKI